MARNVEIKARAADPHRMRALAEGLADGPAEVLVQDDTFYCAPKGRLKLRCTASGRAELIAYERPDDSGPKSCEYHVCPVFRPAELKPVLAQALGVRGRVRKERHLYHCGRTRIHLDRVENLGEFVELEVVLGDGESEEDGRREALGIMARLGLGDHDVVSGAYIDLLEEAKASAGN